MLRVVVALASLAVFTDAQITLDFNCTDGTNLIASATACDNVYADATCTAFFTASTAGGNARDTKCNQERLQFLKVTAGTFSQDAKDFAVATCPKNCGYCCQTPEYNCKNKDCKKQKLYLNIHKLDVSVLDPRVRCETVTKAQCNDPTWRPILAEDCPNVCGFCLTGGCVDKVIECKNDPAICRQVDMQTFVKANCQRTCGYCPTSTTAASVTVAAATAATTKAASSTVTCASAVDTNSNCASWSKNGFCTNTFYTLAQRKQYCAKTCNLC
ncbi:shTK domain protein [Oesophagostomum dentatum]|uniref:ShTK domain protein n=1 Tax=Oesophagostomum dentatum TaxID=61180 RepID=A0A0B1T5C5_OESDE|nr:shTK domain protein [Oesophagostomum dentatum]